MELFKQGKITAEDAYMKASNKTDFEELVGIKKDKQAVGGANSTAQTKK